MIDHKDETQKNPYPCTLYTISRRKIAYNPVRIQLSIEGLDASQTFTECVSDYLNLVSVNGIDFSEEV